MIYLRSHEKVKDMGTISIIIERADDGTYGAYAENVPGIYGMGRTAAEVKQSIRDAIDTVKKSLDTPPPAVLLGDYELAFHYATAEIYS